MKSDRKNNNQVKAFCLVKEYCSRGPFLCALEMFFPLKSNFYGGCGSDRTIHEKMFALMFPDLKEQVAFGVGKKGYKKYGFKRVIVDFYDEKNSIAYEIDGKNHKEELQTLKDRLKDIFLYKEHGIKVLRISNENVEKIMKRQLEILEKEGLLNELFG